MEKQAGSEAEKRNPYEAGEGLWYHGLLVTRITEKGSEGWQVVAVSGWEGRADGVRPGGTPSTSRAFQLQGSRRAFPATPDHFHPLDPQVPAHTMTTGARDAPSAHTTTS